MPTRIVLRKVKAAAAGRIRCLDDGLSYVASIIIFVDLVAGILEIATADSTCSVIAIAGIA